MDVECFEDISKENFLNGKISPIGEFSLGESRFLVYLRPGVEQFLSEASKNFELYLYTHGTTKYCGEVLYILKKRMDELNLPFNLQAIHSRNTQKRIKKNLKKMYCKRSISIIIDDNPDAWCMEDQESILTVTPFKGESEDKELIYLCSYLNSIHEVFFKNSYKHGDVRNILLQNFNV
jgi:TFIIF-interacting CTD phosphatase-like protein